MTLQLIDGTDEYRIAGLAMKVWGELGFSMLDSVYERALMMELKAVTRLYAIHRRQIQFYLSASGIESGLLINFGNARKLECERFERIKSGCRLSGVSQIPVAGLSDSDTSSLSLSERVSQVLGGDA